MTRKMMLIAGAATMALAAPAVAGPKAGHGPQERGGHAPQAQHGGGHASAPRQAPQRMARHAPQRAERVQRPQRIERAPRVQRAERSRSPHAQRMAPMRQVERHSRPVRIERQAQRTMRSTPVRQHGLRHLAQGQQRAVRPQQRMVRHEARQNLRTHPAARTFGQQVAAQAHERNALRQQAHRDWKVGQRIDRAWADGASRVPAFYADRYRDTRDSYFRYDGDRIYQIRRDDGRIANVIPLMGGDYAIGQPLPAAYASNYVPLGYRTLYPDTGDYYYRYGDGGLYQVDSGTGIVTALAALLTGNTLGIGQALPAEYGVYNVPYAYRTRYYDTNDSWYRYNDGYIYQVDPRSRMIEASYPLYSGGYYDVGQPWPAAYPDYNVPMAYRSAYYDTPQYDYRYANGAIYQVNPQTQLIQALVALVTGQPLGVGQTLPAGYGVYNVPLQYRSQYYDTADNWYRYGDGNIYRVDPYSGRIAEVIPTYV